MTTLTAEIIDSWACDPNGPVALHLLARRAGRTLSGGRGSGGHPDYAGSQARSDR